jgi:hypothetical protein
MLIVNVVTQPTGNTNLHELASIAQSSGFNQLDVAAAYVTTGGARDLIRGLQSSMGARWATLNKRWIFAFDYCRSEPLALEMIQSEPRSVVKIFNGWQLLTTKCAPRIPYHPKTFIFRGRDRQVLYAGSGNVSRSGLNTGHEVGLLLGFANPITPAEVPIRRHIQEAGRWFNSIWQVADQLTPQLLDGYRAIFESQENRQRPTPTEDDVAPLTGARGLTPEQLIKLRICRHFWIECGNVTRNFGRDVPGNQLMMKKLSRVFFGVPAVDVPHNSPLTTIAITYNGATKSDCSLTFSDNSMDKLTLPLPGNGGPSSYDGETLLFTRLGAGAYRLELGSSQRKRTWISASRAIGASYSMPPLGRQWGVF